MSNIDTLELTPEQTRAARALLNWSQTDLESASNVARKTLADFEGGKRKPYGRTLTDIRMALEAAGVEFIPENGGGAGVRLKNAIVRLKWRKVDPFNCKVTFLVLYRANQVECTISTNVLDDWDRKNYKTKEQFEKSFDQHISAILVGTEKAINFDRVKDNSLYLELCDFHGAGG